MRGKSLLNEKAIIILSLNQSECRKLLRSASSRIGFSRDTGIEESACKSSCRPLFFAIRKRSSKDLFSLCLSLKNKQDAFVKYTMVPAITELKSGKISKSYIFTGPNPGVLMSMNCELEKKEEI